MRRASSREARAAVRAQPVLISDPPRLSEQLTAPTRWRPTGLQIRQTIRLVAACALAYVVATLVGLPEKYWALITTVVVLQPMLADTLTAGRDRIIGTLLGAAIGFLVLELAQHGLPIMPLFWLSFVPLALLIALFPYLRLAAVTLIIVVLVPGAGSPYARPLDRVVEILLGTIASIIVAALARPWRAAPPADTSHTIE